jgi:Tol biopolymer transport system component
LDLNGYTVFLDGLQKATVPTNGTTAVSLVAGTHNLSLGDISSNCTVTGSNAQSVVIPVHDTARVTFQLACVKTSRIAFTGVADYYTGFSQIWVMNGDGTSLVQLTNHAGQDGGAAWAPDGSKIAFHTNRDGNFEVYVMNADGTGLVNLTKSPAVDSDPAWSPDGSKIAFYSNRDGTDGLYVMNPDGSGVAKVISGTGGFHPTWSPTGTQIAFGCHIDIANRDVCVINADGTGAARLTTDPAVDYEPAWKPDGTKILFVTGRYPSALQLALMNPDGTGVTALGANTGTDVNDPAWSSDGKKIAFHTYFFSCASSSCYTTDIIDVANADGTNAVYATDGSQPAWRP